MAVSQHALLVRTLHDFMERSNLPWQGVHFVRETNADGRPLLDNARVEIWFPYENQKVEVVIYASGSEIDGRMLPVGWLACRKQGAVVKGPLDQATWDNIATLIRG